MSAHSESPTTHVPPSPIRAAGSPFDKASADIILRTVDRVDFRVHSHILIVASPVFESILGLPHTPGSTGDETLDGRPVIEISEDSACLDTILRICYPVEEGSPPTTVEAVEVLLDVAAKYEMHYPSSVLKKHFLGLAAQKPFEAYAAACRLGSEDLARHSAELTLKHQEHFQWSSRDMGAGTAGQYFRLLEFRRLSRAGQLGADYRFVTPPHPVTVSETTELPSSSTQWATTVPAYDLFPNMPFLDLICRSSDGHDFEVHRGIVSSASPILCGRIKELVVGTSIALDDSMESAHSLPVLCLEERMTVASAILRMCYPMASELPIDPQDFSDVFSAAKNYDMKRACKKIQKRWREVAQRSPLRAFFRLVGRKAPSRQHSPL